MTDLKLITAEEQTWLLIIDPDSSDHFKNTWNCIDFCFVLFILVAAILIQGNHIPECIKARSLFSIRKVTVLLSSSFPAVWFISNTVYASIMPYTDGPPSTGAVSKVIHGPLAGLASKRASQSFLCAPPKYGHCLHHEQQLLAAKSYCVMFDGCRSTEVWS